ncbi:hypothetical protein [Fluviicola sp.]|jgi:hypothetical protein|uniref:hypothetical protein n=1 Tax=Fluviicola sp. TaxID=1917219 RepID=UPI00282B977A|nr:hypothetical protein [Fluviicola sp.]MDR0803023.1 hypothetical protein [Fluviicola sp.]
MKIKLILSSLIIATGTGISQTEIPNGVSISAPYKIYESYYRAQFVVKNTMYSLKSDYKKTLLQIHKGENFDLQSVKKIESINGPLVPTPLIFGDKIGFLSKVSSKKTHAIEYNEFDASSNSFLPPVKLSESESNSDIYISNEKNYFAEVTDNLKVSYGLLLGNRKFTHEKIQMSFSVYDSNIEKKWSNSITFPFDDSQYELNSIKVTNKGEIFLFCTIYQNEKREFYSKTGEKTADQVCYCITKDGAAPLERAFLSNFNSATSFYFVSDKDGNDYMAGLYQDKEDGSINYQGFFLSKMVNGEFQEAVGYPFDKEVVDHYLKPGKSGTIQPYSGTGRLSIKNVQFGDDKSVTVFFNQMYSYIRTTKDGSYPVYINQNIFVSHANLNGTGAWTIKLPKNQQSQYEKSELGYFENYTPMYSYLLYVDHKDNFSLPTDETPRTHQCRAGGFMTVCRIDNHSGEIDKKQLFDVSKFYKHGIYLLRFDSFLNIDNKVVFEAYTKMKKFITITIDYEKIF